jgi:hypothetical protein
VSFGSLRPMDQHERQDKAYEAPVVEDVDVAEGPSSVAPGGVPITIVD